MEQITGDVDQTVVAQIQLRQPPHPVQTHRRHPLRVCARALLCMHACMHTYIHACIHTYAHAWRERGKDARCRRGRECERARPTEAATPAARSTHGHPYLQGRGPESEKIEVHESAGGQERVKQRGGHCMLPRQIQLCQLGQAR